VATHAEPLAPFYDCAVIGDGEEKTTELLLTWCALKKAGVPRRERLRELAKLGGIYVPCLYDTELEAATGMQVVAAPRDPQLPYPVLRAFVPDLGKHPFPTSGPVARPRRSSIASRSRSRAAAPRAAASARRA
jgi:radical SAM superfamily enzyme YgiQ (UPF0313 family)